VSAAQLHYLGRERQPLLVIDDFVPEPQALIDEAAALAFTPIGPHYPGIRAGVSAAQVRAFLAPIVDLVCGTFDCGSHLQVIEAYYSLVTTRPADLRPIQRLPHFDGLERERLALLHFIGRDRSSGTAFYRQRSTGFESVDAARYPQFCAAIDRDRGLYGLPEPAYISGDTPMYEQIASFEGRFNRALVYRGHLLHCALLPEDLSYSSNPREGRLTVNTFLMGTD
jgi:hypothetical protein